MNKQYDHAYGHDPYLGSIEDGPSTVAVLHMPSPPRRSIEECIALLPEDSPATIALIMLLAIA